MRGRQPLHHEISVCWTRYYRGSVPGDFGGAPCASGAGALRAGFGCWCRIVGGVGRDRIRALTDRRGLLPSVQQIVEDLNRFLRSWAACFRLGNTGRYFDKIMGCAGVGLAGVLTKRHRRCRGSSDRYWPFNLRTTSA
jgi:Group II intron, maturase-specific domain